MSLYHTYRPQSLDEIYGNTAMLSVLKADLAKKNPPKAILLVGPYGAGKTTIARIIAKELGCVGQDFVELNASAFRGIDTVREIDKQSRYKSLESKCRVWLWDESHQIGSGAAMPAMLKMLEDPPEHVYHILATTDPQKLLPTIRSRCALYQVSLLSEQEMYKLLRSIVRKENEELEKEIYDEIIRSSEGHPRNALQILDQVLAVDDEQRLEIAKHSQAIQTQTIELCRALVNKSPWKKVSLILQGLKDEEEESIRRAIFNYAGTILLKGDNRLAALIMDEMHEPLYNQGWYGIVLACYKIVSE